MNVHLYIFVKFQLFYEKISLPNKLIFFFFNTTSVFSEPFSIFWQAKVPGEKKQGLELNSHSEIRKSLFPAGALTDFLLVLELIHHLCGPPWEQKCPEMLHRDWGSPCPGAYTVTLKIPRARNVHGDSETALQSHWYFSLRFLSFISFFLSLLVFN